MTDREFAIKIVEQLQQAGFEALFAGGCVRDQMLDRQPKDYDVATSATPEQVRDLFGHKKTLAIGAAFGVITVLPAKGSGLMPIEIATFRRDAGYSDGRRPDAIEFTDSKEDALRRDFTINGMFFDPIKDEVVDYVGGKADLAAKQIRAIRDPHERIDEDKLRMLRGVRFAATFDFALEPETLAAIQEHASEIRVVSPERIGNELRRMLSHPNKTIAMRLLIQSRLWQEVLPEFARDETFDDTFWKQRTAEVEKLNSNDFASVVATLFWPICQKYPDQKKSPGLASQLHLAWRLTNDDRDSLKWISNNMSVLADFENRNPKWSEVQPSLIHRDAPRALDVAEAHVGLTDAIQSSREKLSWPEERLNPDPLIDGAALRQAGINPGPAYSKIITTCRAQQLDNVISTTEEAIELAKQIANAP